MSEQHVDFDLHERILVRLVGACAADARAVERQLGLPPVSSDRPADIVVRFTDQLPLPPAVRLLGTGDVGYCDQYFYVFRGKRKAAMRVIVPIDQLGEPCEFVCQRGITAVPLLIAAINLRALAIGLLPVHACAFEYRGRGILCTGWSKGGKTETLLGFMAHGATYVGDEWVYLDGESMFGIPEPVHIWDWHLHNLTQYRGKLGWKARWKLAQSRAVVAGLEGATRLPVPPLSDVARRLLPAATRQRHVKVAPHKLFGQTAFKRTARFEQLVFVHSHSSEEYQVRSVPPEEVAAAMLYSLLEERADLVSAYQHYRFGFPGRENPWINRLEPIQQERIGRFFAKTPAHALYHPYPVCPARMFTALEPVLTS